MNSVTYNAGAFLKGFEQKQAGHGSFEGNLAPCLLMMQGGFQVCIRSEHRAVLCLWKRSGGTPYRRLVSKAGLILDLPASASPCRLVNTVAAWKKMLACL